MVGWFDHLIIATPVLWHHFYPTGVLRSFAGFQCSLLHQLRHLFNVDAVVKLEIRRFGKSAVNLVGFELRLWSINAFVVIKCPFSAFGCLALLVSGVWYVFCLILKTLWWFLQQPEHQPSNRISTTTMLCSTLMDCICGFLFANNDPTNQQWPSLTNNRMLLFFHFTSVLDFQSELGSCFQWKVNCVAYESYDMVRSWCCLKSGLGPKRKKAPLLPYHQPHALASILSVSELGSWLEFPELLASEGQYKQLVPAHQLHAPLPLRNLWLNCAQLMT